MQAFDDTSAWLHSLAAYYRLYPHDPIKGGKDNLLFRCWRDERVDRTLLAHAVDNDWPCMVIGHVLYAGLTAQQARALTPEGLTGVYLLAALMPEPDEMICRYEHEPLPD